MSSSISIKLNGLLQDHRNTTRTFSDISQSEIVIKAGLKYRLQNVQNSTVTINAGCTQLILEKCKNITITAEKFPVMGIVVVRSDNIKIDVVGTPQGSGSGFISLEHSIMGEIGSDQDCMVEVNECIGITLNEVNISDKYRDSTWKITE